MIVISGQTRFSDSLPLCFFNREIQNSTNSLSVLQNVCSHTFDMVTLFMYIYIFQHGQVDFPKIQ